MVQLFVCLHRSNNVHALRTLEQGRKSMIRHGAGMYFFKENRRCGNQLLNGSG